VLHIVEWSDVLCVGLTVDVKIKDSGVLYLNVIKVRPCFVGRGMLQIIVYILIVAAILRKDVKRVVVEKCVETTVAVLEAKFASMFVIETDTKGYRSCVFGGFDAMNWKSLKTQLGLDNRLRINDSGGEITKICLVESAYPTAEQLNDRSYVESNFKLPVSVDILARERAMEDVFSSRRGDVNENYISGQLAPLFKQIYHGVYGGDGFEIKHMDRIEFDSDVASMNVSYAAAEKRFQISDVAVRPCFLAFGIVHMVVLQLMCATRNCEGGGDVKIGVECDRVIGRSLNHVFGKSVEVKSTSSGVFVLEIGFVDDFVGILDEFDDLIRDDVTGWSIVLDESGFPSAVALNGVIAVERRKLLAELDADIAATAGELGSMTVSARSV
jgi:hypothetical protein